MTSTDSAPTVRLGIVGACGRGLGFRTACEAIDAIRVTAVCDTNHAELDATRESLGAERAFADYGEMLDSGDVDAVLIATPMPLHAPQAIAGLQRGLHVLSEVPAAVSIAQCRDLVAAAKNSAAVYMMGENCVYFRSNQIVKAIVETGAFGTLYYAEGQYLHETKALNETTPWRRRWQTGINGITYGTHSLGPILAWMPGDRVTSVTCRGSGHHYDDPRGKAYENEDTCVMLAKTDRDALINVRVDLISDRPGSMNIYQLQGTDGSYESARTPGQGDRIWLRGQSPHPGTWTDLDDVGDAYLPLVWQRHDKIMANIGHGGSDLVTMDAFARSVSEVTPPDIGIHEAMDMTIPGLISQASIQQAGAWLDVPDSRRW